ncbi:MAG: antA/AntB antirepressor family protein [Rouxiella badensis]|uniref:antA/AntB antirepressor family protein n=1 Tax=Rouxiella badensis TaxID=1646377 RepID=UPI003C6062F1
MKKLTALTGSTLTQPESNLSAINTGEFASLVPVIPSRIGGRETNIVSAKALHTVLGVGRDFSTWFTDRVEEYGFVRDVDFFTDEDMAAAWLSNDQYSPVSGKIKGRGRPQKDYSPTLAMAKELAMVERNDQGRAVRRYFIQCEEALQLSAPAIAAKYRRQLKARIGAANMFKPMCAALDVARAEEGKRTLPRHYTNESNMISRIVLGGLTAKQWARVNGITGEARDGMSADQLEHFTYLESTNITLIDMGMAYDQRKAELMRLSQRWMAKRLEVLE